MKHELLLTKIQSLLWHNMSPWQRASPVKTPFILSLVAYISKTNSVTPTFYFWKVIRRAWFAGLSRCQGNLLHHNNDHILFGNNRCFIWYHIKHCCYVIQCCSVIRSKQSLLSVETLSIFLNCSKGDISFPVTEISVTGSVRPLVWTEQNRFTKASVVRRDLGNRASSVN